MQSVVACLMFICCFVVVQQSNARPPPVGSRVRRGPHWKWANQDGGRAGTIVKTDATPGQFRHQQFFVVKVAQHEIKTYSTF